MKKLGGIFRLAIVGLIATSLMTVAAFPAGAITASATDKGATLGDSASFSLRALDGATVSSATTRGKVVVLAFGALWLPVSRSQAQSLQQLANKYGARGVEVFWVSTDSESSKSKNYASDEALHNFADKNRLQVTILRDPDGATLKRAFNVNQVPAIIVLDRQGNIADTINGYDPKNDLVTQLSPQIDKLLQ